MPIPSIYSIQRRPVHKPLKSLDICYLFCYYPLRRQSRSLGFKSPPAQAGVFHFRYQ